MRLIYHDIYHNEVIFFWFMKLFQGVVGHLNQLIETRINIHVIKYMPRYLFAKSDKNCDFLKLFLDKENP